MPHPSEAMKAYRKLEQQLRNVRAKHALGSINEDPILEEMAKLWWILSEDERELLDQEGPTCDPEEEPRALLA